MSTKSKDAAWSTLSLFASLSTLLCCALPALLITLGLGAVLAGIVSNVPGLIWLSQYKAYVFLVSGCLLIAAGFARKKAQGQACPADPAQARACGRLRAVSGWIYWISVVLYGVGFYFAFLAKFFL